MEKVIKKQDIWQGSKMQVLKTQVRVCMKNASMDNASTSLQRPKKQVQKKQVHENTVCCLIEKRSDESIAPLMTLRYLYSVRNLHVVKFCLTFK